jgi:predicted Fe-Mo cluster-binding NifX family protein
MKIAIASNEGRSISSHFGRTRGFMIYEIEDNKVKEKQYRENIFTGHARGHHHEQGNTHQGIHHHGAILRALSDCQVVISQGMGSRLYEELRSNGIEAFIVNEQDVDKAVNLYLQNNLQNHPDKECEH